MSIDNKLNSNYSKNTKNKLIVSLSEIILEILELPFFNNKLLILTITSIFQVILIVLIQNLLVTHPAFILHSNYSSNLDVSYENSISLAFIFLIYICAPMLFSIVLSLLFSNIINVLHNKVKKMWFWIIIIILIGLEILFFYGLLRLLDMTSLWKPLLIPLTLSNIIFPLTFNYLLPEYDFKKCKKHINKLFASIYLFMCSGYIILLTICPHLYLSNFLSTLNITQNYSQSAIYTIDQDYLQHMNVADKFQPNYPKEEKAIFYRGYIAWNMGDNVIFCKKENGKECIHLPKSAISFWSN